MNVTRTLNAFAEGDDSTREEEDGCLLTVEEESTKLVSKEQADNQRRIKGEIKEFFLASLGGWPETIDGKPVSYGGVQVNKLWGNRYRVNMKVKDKNGNVKYPHSCLAHYQKNHIMIDEKSPITKLYSNYEETLNAPAEIESSTSTS